MYHEGRKKKKSYENVVEEMSVLLSCSLTKYLAPVDHFLVSQHSHDITKLLKIS